MPFDGTNYDKDAVTSVPQVNNPVTDLLERAWSLIDKPQKWCRGQPKADNGRRQCSMGALYTVASRHGTGTGYALATATLARAIAGVPGPLPAPFTIAAFNDSHSHREVAAAWQRAIALSQTLP